MPIPWIFLLSFASVCKLMLFLFPCILSQVRIIMIWKSLISLPHFSDGDYWISQDQLSLTRKPNKTVHISCKLSGVPLQNTIVHWYQLREGEPIKRIFYGSAKTQKQDKLNSRLETDEKSDGTFYLIINNVIRADEATYYCACWDLTVSYHLREPV